MSIICLKCKREFPTQADLEKHLKVFAYSDSTDPQTPHDLEHLEQTVSYLLYSRDLIQKSCNEIYQEYGILERKFHGLLDKTTHTQPITQFILSDVERKTQ